MRIGGTKQQYLAVVHQGRFCGRLICTNYCISAALLICPVLLAVVALRTMNLSQLVSFAAGAYVLVPLGSHFIFGDRLFPRFWVGALLIISGILCTNF